MVKWLKSLFGKKEERIPDEILRGLDDCCGLECVPDEELIAEIKARSDVLLLIAINFDEEIREEGIVFKSYETMSIKGFEHGYLTALDVLHRGLAARRAEKKDIDKPCDLIIYETKAR